MFNETLSKSVTAALKPIYIQVKNLNANTILLSKHFGQFKATKVSPIQQTNLIPEKIYFSFHVWFIYSLFEYLTSYLKEVIVEFLNFCFNTGDKVFIGITKGWEKYRLSFSKTSFKLAIHYLRRNSYFTLASLCFGQLIGVFNGPDPAPLWKTCFCIIMKGSDLFKQKKEEIRKSRIFSNIFRFIAEICTFPDNGFESSYNDICPDVPDLRKENEYPLKRLVFGLFNKNPW